MVMRCAVEGCKAEANNKFRIGTKTIFIIIEICEKCSSDFLNKDVFEMGLI